MIAIVDYGLSNLGSVFRAFRKLNDDVEIVTDASQIDDAQHIVLPGVGSYLEGMNCLKRRGWDEALQTAASDRGVPILGICLGMQFLASKGNEGGVAKGLSLIPGEVVHLRDIGEDGRIPHVGWNDIKSTGTGCPLLNGIPDGTDFYFVHSYAFQTASVMDLAATVDYGVRFPAIVGQGNVWGVQFHPEKSSVAGMRILRNFLEM